MRRPVLRSALLVLVLTLALAACGESGSEPGLTEPTTSADAPEPEDTEEPDAPAEDDDTGTDDTGNDDTGTDDTGTDDTGTDPTDEGEAAADGGAATDGPTALADPCADQQGREGDAFIEVVAPVAEQQVDDLADVELVGCSNVFEANVQWALYDGDGRTLDEGFTTAECGSGCVGEFRETLDLTAADGEPFAELHVFSESAEDGSAQFLTAIPLVLG